MNKSQLEQLLYDHIHAMALYRMDIKQASLRSMVYLSGFVIMVLSITVLCIKTAKDINMLPTKVAELPQFQELNKRLDDQDKLLKETQLKLSSFYVTAYTQVKPVETISLPKTVESKVDHSTSKKKTI